MVMLHGTYIGPDKTLQGKKALLSLQKHSIRLLAQFDDLLLPMSYVYGWKEFPESYFKLDNKGMSRWITEQRK